MLRKPEVTLNLVESKRVIAWKNKIPFAGETLTLAVGSSKVFDCVGLPLGKGIDRFAPAVLPCSGKNLLSVMVEPRAAAKHGVDSAPRLRNGVLPSAIGVSVAWMTVLQFEKVLQGPSIVTLKHVPMPSSHVPNLLDNVFQIDSIIVAAAKCFNLLLRPGVGISVIERMSTGPIGRNSGRLWWKRRHPGRSANAKVNVFL